MLRRLQASKTFVCAYKSLHFCANTQKFLTLVTAEKIIILKVGGGTTGAQEARAPLKFSPASVLAIASSEAVLIFLTLPIYPLLNR